VLIHVLNGV